MKKQGPILVPLDGSELAERALPMAMQLASTQRTHLVLLSVWEEPGSGTPPALSMEMEERAQDYFQTYLCGVRDRLQRPEIRVMVRCGDPSDSILEVAEEIGARMIVVSSHGRSGVSRWRYGSTASRLLHESKVPLTVVGPKAASDPTAARGVRHIMVPLDGSRLAEVALDAGTDLALAFGAKLSLVRAVGWAYETYPYAGAATYIPSWDRDLELAAKEYVRNCESRVDPTLKVSGFVVRGATAAALLAFEDQRDVDLVVMTTHARSGIARSAFGSTAERMLQGRTPVLLIRPEQPVEGRATQGASRDAVATG